MVSFDLEVDDVTDSGITCNVKMPSGPLDLSVYVMATFYADVNKGIRCKSFNVYLSHVSQLIFKILRSAFQLRFATQFTTNFVVLQQKTTTYIVRLYHNFKSTLLRIKTSS